MEYRNFCYFSKNSLSVYSVPAAIPGSGFIPLDDYLLSTYYVLGIGLKCHSLQARRSWSSERPIPYFSALVPSPEDIRQNYKGLLVSQGYKQSVWTALRVFCH